MVAIPNSGADVRQPVRERTTVHSGELSVFESFAAEHGARLKQALVARYGTEFGADAAAAAMAWAFEHWSDVSVMANPLGYLYRVGQSSQRATWRWRNRSLTFPSEQVSPADLIDVTRWIDLGTVIGALPDRQRTCVLLVHAHRWTYAEVAELLDISVDAVTNHVHRGTNALRKLLKENAS